MLSQPRGVWRKLHFCFHERMLLSWHRASHLNCALHCSQSVKGSSDKIKTVSTSTQQTMLLRDKQVTASSSPVGMPLSTQPTW